MLGLARHSQLAGWGSVPPSFKDSAEFTTTLLSSVYPRYYADFSAVTQPAYELYKAIPTSSTIDATGLGTSYKKKVLALTFRIGDDFLSGDWTNSDVIAGTTGTFYDVHTFAGSNTGLEIRGMWNFTTSQVTIAMRTQTFSRGVELSRSELDSIRNVWVTLVCATSDSTSDFSSWTGTGTNTYSWAGRFMLINAETGEVIKQSDSYAQDPYWSADLTETWTFVQPAFSYNSSEYAHYMACDIDFGGSGSAYNYANDIQVLSSWACFGSMFDVKDYYNELIGVGIGDTIQSQRAWHHVYFNEAGTSYDSVTNRQTDSNAGDRVSDSYSDIVCASGTKPSWTLFSDLPTPAPVLYTETFTSTNTWTAPAGVTEIEYFIVGGGAAGGTGGQGGGGGAGGILYGVNLEVTPGTTYLLEIGAGATPSSTTQTSGSNSYLKFNSNSAIILTAVGGGAGGGELASGMANSVGKTGGSGGGGCHPYDNTGTSKFNISDCTGFASTQTASAPTGIVFAKGYAGGNGRGQQNGTYGGVSCNDYILVGGGGGGGGAAGGNWSLTGGAAGHLYAGNGGVGYQYDSNYYGGGGGGGYRPVYTGALAGRHPGVGGLGGGQSATAINAHVSGGGTANTGGGGAGVCCSSNSGPFKGGAGGSGIAIIKYYA